MSKLLEAAGLGQSIWLNSFDRAFIHSHRLLDLIHLGVHGITSDPAAIAKAIGDSSDYDQQLLELVHEGKEVSQIAEELLFTDIETAVDLIHPVYERTNGVDGYVSLDVNPAVEDDAEQLVSEGLRLVDLAVQGVDLQAIERQLQAEGVKDLRLAYQLLDDNVIHRMMSQPRRIGYHEILKIVLSTQR